MAWLNDGTVQGWLLGSGAVLVWALALYVASRAPGRRASVLAAAAMLCLAVYLGGEALGALAPDVADWSSWVRRTWWAPCLALPLWLGLSLALAADEGPSRLAAWARRWWLPLTLLALGIGGVFGGVGVASNLVQDWSAPFSVGASGLAGGEGVRHHPPGPLLGAFQVFTLVCVMWATLNLVSVWRSSPRGTPLRARFAWFSASAVLFLAGGAWVALGSGLYLLVGLPGQALLIAGMLILGWTMARYGALLAGEQVLGDFLAYAATMLGIVGLYGAIILTLAPDYAWLERGLPLLLVIMATHVAVDTRGHLLERRLYAPGLGVLRAQLRDLGNRVVRQPDELSALADVRESLDQLLREQPRSSDAVQPAELRVLVEGALRHLNELPALVRHPLLAYLPRLAEQGGTPLEQAAHVRQELEQAIERLRPSGARPSPGSSAIGGWTHYLVLKEAYVDGRPNKQIMQRYALSEGTFHRARRRAIDALAADLASRGGVAEAVRQ
ncbi:MAG: hypothetical protein JO057_08030 [Chloroflexi bacterium]|nr:hypothetical protein [Chloroflexota bacterium]